jgi:hypothetical protein
MLADLKHVKVLEIEVVLHGCHFHFVTRHCCGGASVVLASQSHRCYLLNFRDYLYNKATSSAVN